MTQKELLYYEDAIKHEENIIKIIDISLDSLESEVLIEFMNSEKNIHNEIKNNLMEKLEVNTSE